ncbi:MAG: hypothetical protein ACI8PZ_000577 [Myxococcota bacterium]|jgi:hypothetical protein
MKALVALLPLLALATPAEAARFPFVIPVTTCCDSPEPLCAHGAIVAYRDGTAVTPWGAGTWSYDRDTRTVEFTFIGGVATGHVSGGCLVGDVELLGGVTGVWDGCIA